MDSGLDTSNVVESGGFDTGFYLDTASIVDDTSNGLGDTFGFGGTGFFSGDSGSWTDDSGLISDSGGSMVDDSSLFGSDSGVSSESGIGWNDSGLLIDSSGFIDTDADSGDSLGVHSGLVQDSGDTDTGDTDTGDTDTGDTDTGDTDTGDTDTGDTSTNNYLDYLTDDCLESSTAPVLSTPGVYQWPAVGYSDMSTLATSGCTGYPSDGIDGMLKVELQAGETLDARYRLVGGDASLYLLTDCWTPTTCVSGSDSNWSIGGIEQLNYTNVTGATAVYTLVLDEYFYNGGASIFQLELDIY
jgi:hypothetical protein